MKLSSRLLLLVCLCSVFTFGAFARAQQTLVFGYPKEMADELAARQALSRRVTLDARDASVADVVSWLESTIHLPIVIDKRGLDDAGIDAAETMVSFQCTDMPARDVLNLLLRRIDLTYTVKGPLVITTPEVAASDLVVRIYPVADLVAVAMAGEATVHFEFDSLITAITSTIQPTSWDEVGGPGSVTPEHSAGVLVVSQTRDVHEQIEQLLRSLRSARAAQGLTTSEPAAAFQQKMEAWSTATNQSEWGAPEPEIIPVQAWQVSRRHE